MRRTRGNKRGDILIDLTSLLDVIFIVLLIVLCEQGVINRELDESRDSYQNAEKQVEDVKKLYNDMIDTADNLNQYVWAASITVPYQSELTSREIKVLVEGQEIRSFSLMGSDVDEALEEFRNYLEEYINETEGKPVILSLNENDEDILYRDEVAVSNILSELLKNYDNVYLK